MCVDPFLERAAELLGGIGGNFVEWKSLDVKTREVLMRLDVC